MQIAEYLSLLESPINRLLNQIGDELKQVAKNRLLEYQSIEYKRNFYSKTLLHRSEPVKLSEFYQPLNIIKLKSFGDNTRSGKPISTANVKELFKKNNYLTIIGNAGSGKSTIVKYLFVNAVSTNFKIPIKIELRYLNDYKKSFNNYVYEEIFQFFNLGFSDAIIERLLNSDSFVFFLDGYDEVNSNIKENFTHELDKFISKFPKNNYIVTSRPYTNIEALPLFTNYVVCELEDSEIIEFVQKQTSNAPEELSEKITKAINQIDNRSYKQFLKNPLLLSMFILTFQSYSEIPQKISDFYKQVFDTLYSVHDSVSKLSYVREKLSGLSREKFEEILKLFSFISYFESKFLFKREYLELKFNLIKSKKGNLNFDNEKLIEDLQVAIGILNKDGVEYTFPHRSLQEYFAANYISSLSDKNKELIYKKLRTTIQHTIIYLIENSHFLTLLSEQDYNNLLKNISIPLLKKEISRIKGKTEPSDNLIYDVYCKLYLYSFELVREKNFKCKIHEDLLKLDLQESLYMGRGKFTFSLESVGDENLKRKMKTVHQLVNKNGDFWLEDLENKIIKDEKSDTEIINFI